MANILTALAALLSLGATGTSSVAGQDAARQGLAWGETPQAVHAAMPNLREVRNGTRLDAGRVRFRGEQILADLTLETKYYFDNVGLTMIALEGPRKKCREMIAAIDRRYGPPLRIADEMILLNAIWHSEQDGTRIRLMTSPAAGVCTLHYEPLHLHRERDLANPGLRRRDPRRDLPFD